MAKFDWNKKNYHLIINGRFRDNFYNLNTARSRANSLSGGLFEQKNCIVVYAPTGEILYETN